MAYGSALENTLVILLIVTYYNVKLFNLLHHNLRNRSIS